MTTATATTSQIAAGVWELDSVHSNVDFIVRHMGVAWIRGSFDAVEATMQVADDGRSTLRGVVRVDSVHTRSEQLTGHLMSPDFFDQQMHPTLTFSSDPFVLESGALTVAGELTIKGITRPVTLTGQVDGAGPDAFGNERAAIELTTTVDRTQFDLNWNAPLPGGGVAVANNVKLVATIEFIKQ